ncbi:hypothetical protein BROUX41_001829 [Berkeleyomyces rouxiae]|uniref:uncharacterized protein n=1 Tax=Berkeleyomyces rouxiae TaxID=2035830 RepID=UPI003B764B71
MALSVIVKVTLQAAAINALSNLIAQGLAVSRASLAADEVTQGARIDWISMFQFVLFAVLNTPPNFLWQVWLEDMFPSYHAAPPAPKSTADTKPPAPSKPRLNVRHTAIKFVLDQTVGAAVNTLLFSVVMGALKASMTPQPGEALDDVDPSSAAYLFSARAVDAARVDWPALWAGARADFWPIVMAGWRLWPAVSLVNYAVVQSVEMRNLLGNLAGLGWGVYMSMLAAGQ